jgi:hypothetical protein
MNYTLLDTITQNAKFTANEDGTITAKNVIVKVGIVGAPANKFIQVDVVPEFNIPASTTSANQPAYIDAQAQAYVTATYPNI